MWIKKKCKCWFSYFLVNIQALRSVHRPGTVDRILSGHCSCIDETTIETHAIIHFWFNLLCCSVEEDWVNNIFFCTQFTVALYLYIPLHLCCAFQIEHCTPACTHTHKYTRTHGYCGEEQCRNFPPPPSPSQPSDRTLIPVPGLQGLWMWLSQHLGCKMLLSEVQRYL